MLCDMYVWYKKINMDTDLQYILLCLIAFHVLLAKKDNYVICDSHIS